MRGTQRIERQGKGAKDEDADDVAPLVGAGEEGEKQTDDDRAGGGGENDDAPVVAVGVDAERILQHHAADDAGTHEGGDGGDGHSDLFGIDRPHIAKRRHAETDGHATDDGKRRDAPDREQIEGNLLRRRGVGFVGNRDRHQRQRQCHGDQRKHHGSINAGDGNYILGERHGTEIDETIDGQRARTVGIRHLRIDPAFYRGKKTGDGNADDEAHQHPEQGMEDERHGN
ncbi:hypothetical protein SRABI46_01455 [Agrobacterium fabrum]|nr:hypothetical protein SRABI46_01455 [Agrobacterium fabrum]